MSSADVIVNAAPKKAKAKSLLKMTVERIWHDKPAMFGFIGVVILVLLAIFAPLISPYSPTEMDMAAINQVPSAQHFFGTDSLGRDILSRCLYGGRYSLGLGILSSGFATVLGIIFGSIAGFYGRWVDTVIMRFCDIIQAIPAMVISIIISLTLGTGYVVTIIALALGGFTFSTRLTRGQVLSVRTSEYLEAAKTINCSSARIMFRHILPNIFSPILLEFTMKISQMIQLAASLSVIGLGVPASTPEWGAMLSAGRNLLTNYPHLVIFPGLFIFAISLFINMFGDGLRDALDPRLKK